MKFVLLSGGSGKRLWPLSNQSRSKQFLKLLPTADGEYESMIQRVFRQICSSVPDADILITTSPEQQSVIIGQLGDSVRVLTEPERRDTFPAIMLAASYIASFPDADADETVMILPVDPYAEDGFFEKTAMLEKLVRSENCNMALLGIEPTYPSEKYGYILPESGGGEEQKVRSFHEKPTADRAQELIDSGAYWNAGVFAVRLSHLLDILRENLGTCEYNEVRSRYSELKKTSFDYAVVEHEKNIGMLTYSGPWKDLGTWNTLAEKIGWESVGNVVTGEGTEHTYIINELSVPVVALGIKDAVIAASPDGILVSDLNKSSYMKPYVDKIDQRPMFEERNWGDYKVLDYDRYENGLHSLTRHMTVKPGCALSYCAHNMRDEILTIIDGTADLLIDGHIRNVRPGDVAYICKGQKHSIRAVTAVHLIEVQLGEEISDSDVERFEWEW